MMKNVNIFKSSDYIKPFIYLLIFYVITDNFGDGPSDEKLHFFCHLNRAKHIIDVQYNVELEIFL